MSEFYYSINVILDNLQNTDEGRNSYYSPPIDIYENEEGFFLELELAGVDANDIKIYLSENKIFIKGIKRCSNREGQVKYYLLERPFGAFEKVIKVPENIDRDNIRADFKDGVLKVSLPYKRKKLVVE